MQNKFSRSINARNEAEARRKTAQVEDKTIPEETNTISDVEVIPDIPVTPVTSETPEILPRGRVKADTRENANGLSLSSILKSAPKRAASNKTFYLDGQVIRAVKESARRQNVPESKLVNDILRFVLRLDED